MQGPALVSTWEPQVLALPPEAVPSLVRSLSSVQSLSCSDSL